VATQAEQPPEPPANWNTPPNTSSAPTVLEVYANGAGSGSGTGASLKLTYVNKAGTYACTISGGVPSGTTRTCVPSKSSDSASSDYDRFYITFTNSSNSDGLRYSTVRVTINGTSYAVNEFSPANATDGEFTCQGCDAWGLCGSCWLDGAGHGKCVSVELSMTYEFPVDCVAFN